MEKGHHLITMVFVGIGYLWGFIQGRYPNDPGLQTDVLNIIYLGFLAIAFLFLLAVVYDIYVLPKIKRNPADKK